jgi:hypothetical protein
MNNKQMLSIFWCLIFSCTHMLAFIRGHSFFSPRSQSVHAERELVGWQEDINLCTDGVSYGSFSIMPIYSHSIKSTELARYFFGEQCFVVSGSRVPDREKREILADYFGLPLDFKSFIKVTPVINNSILDFNLYVGLDAWYPGLYVRVHAPFVHTVWNMQLREQVQSFGELDYPAGYMASGVVERADMAASVTSWFAGVCAPIGDIQPLKFGKMNGACSRSGFSEIQTAFGMNFFTADTYHFGMNIRVGIPTGNHSKSIYFFEPMIGNGGHCEVGFGFTGHTQMWQSCDAVSTWSVYGDMNITHLCSAYNRRSFDFKKNGAGSRYILLEEIGVPVVQGLMVGGEVADQQYHGVLLPAINVTTLDAFTSIGMQVDAVLKFAYEHCNYTFEGGYNLWARTGEQIDCREQFPNNRYAVKGDAQVYGFNRDNQRFVALNATQSRATIRAGQGEGNANKDFTNANADNATDEGDNPVFATFDFGVSTDLTQAFPPIEDVRGSLQAVLLTDNDIDTLSAASPSALSHTLFVHSRYTFAGCTCVTPYLGLGGEITVDGSGSRKNDALSEWAFWIKGGIAY